MPVLTHAEFVRMVVEVCALSLQPGITPDRLAAYATVESGRNTEVISRPNTDGSRDYGLMQINSQWFGKFGVNAATIMEPCTNLRIGAIILADADRQAACIYNTGRALCRNGYDEKIVRAQARIAGAPPAPLAPVAAPEPPPPAECGPVPPDWDGFALARHSGCVRRMRSAPPPSDRGLGAPTTVASNQPPESR